VKPFGEDEPSYQRNDHRQRSARPDIVTDDHRDPHCQADDGVAYHDRFVLDRGLDNSPAARHEAGHEQDREKPDGSRKENRELGHFNLRCLL
jgi:hypothetical protein